MKKIIFYLICIFYSNLSFSSDFCQKNEIDFKVLFSEKNNRISFENQGGLFGGGVCWWHNRMQRVSTYLASYQPLNLKPSKTQAISLLRLLKRMDNKIVIPGFSNFHDFTKYFKNETQQVLNEWQRIDGFLNQKWIQGISGRYKMTDYKLKDHLDRMRYKLMNAQIPIWIMLQLKGISSHSALLLEMNETNEGYEMLVVDSNNPLANTVLKYTYGDESMFYGKDPYIPYIGFEGDVMKIKRTISKYCP